jgi:hypothetical protein
VGVPVVDVAPEHGDVLGVVLVAEIRSIATGTAVFTACDERKSAGLAAAIACSLASAIASGSGARGIDVVVFLRFAAVLTADSAAIGTERLDAFGGAIGLL